MLTARSLSLLENVCKEYDIFIWLPFLSPDEYRAYPLVFWKQASDSKPLPLLAITARFVYTVPDMFVPSKRIFSRAGLIREKNRGSLTPANAEFILRVGDYHRMNRA